MDKVYFTVKVKLNRAAYERARTSVHIMLVDSSDPMPPTVFRNDGPYPMPREFEFRTHVCVEVVRVWVFSRWRPPHEGQRPGVRITVEHAGRYKVRDVWADRNGTISFCDCFVAEMGRVL